jgi:hypothetical protein
MKYLVPSAMMISIVISTGCRPDAQHNRKEATMAATQPSDSAPSEPKRVAGLEKGWELVPSAQYTATQSAGQVTITATGENPTAGYETKLVQSMLRIWPPQYLLARKPPDGMVAQVITPFKVTASFKASDPIKQVTVTDGAGKHQVAVK